MGAPSSQSIKLLCRKVLENQPFVHNPKKVHLCILDSLFEHSPIFAIITFFLFDIFSVRQSVRKSRKLSRSSLYYSFDGDAIDESEEGTDEAIVQMKSVDQRSVLI